MNLEVAVSGAEGDPTTVDAAVEGTAAIVDMVAMESSSMMLT